MANGFESRLLQPGLLYKTSQPPSLVLRGWLGDDLPLTDKGSTHFVFLLSGRATLHRQGTAWPLTTGMYASVPGPAVLGGTGWGMIISHTDYRGVFHLGGPIEVTGRLRYIDGCSDSLLIPPVVRGDPCLNLLHVPSDVSQTPHTHPSHRIGLVVQGQGICRSPEQEHPLQPGLAWVIPPNSLHSFHTTEESLTILAFHPDSDFGPSHDDHPMLNRTLVDGMSMRRQVTDQ